MVRPVIGILKIKCDLSSGEAIKVHEICTPSELCKLSHNLARCAKFQKENSAVCGEIPLEHGRQK